LADEVLHQGPRARIGQHAPDLPLHHGRIAEPAALGTASSSSSGMLLQRKKERRDAQLDVAHPVNAPGRRAHRIELDAEKELGRHQDLLQRQSHARLEAAGLGALLVEGDELRQIVGGNRPPVGVAREAGDDLFAQACCSARSAGRQTKILSRLGVAPGPCALKGPETEMLPTPSKWACIASARGLNRMPSWITVSFLERATSVCVPAFTGKRILRLASGQQRPSGCLCSPSGHPLQW